tara:strand:+ start:15503 stop:15664 length:162 start_codon:yes stop_codon:yes gene_type:complete
MITHIQFVCKNIHDFGDDLYTHLSERENEEAKQKAQELIEVLADLIQSLTDEI